MSSLWNVPLGWVTQHNINNYKKDMKELLHFYDSWYLAVIQGKCDSDQFMVGTTYQILRISIRGFFEYCRIAFRLSPLLRYTLIMQLCNQIPALLRRYLSMYATWKEIRPLRDLLPQPPSVMLWREYLCLQGKPKRPTTIRIFQLNCHLQKILQEGGMTTDWRFLSPSSLVITPENLVRDL